MSPTSGEDVGRRLRFVVIEYPGISHVSASWMFWLLFSILILTCVFVISVSVLFSSVVAGPVLAIVLPISIIFLMRTFRGRTKRARVKPGSSGDPASVVQSTMSATKLQWRLPGRLTREFKELIADGVTGVVVWLMPKDSFQPVAPIPHPFEPVPLDEADVWFQRLRGAVDGEYAKERDPMLGRVRRNYLMKGGGAMLAFLLFQLLLNGLPAWRSGDLQYWLAFLACLFVFFFMGVRTGSGKTTQPWLIVPGGLFLRGRASSVRRPHLFRASESILCVYRYEYTQYAFLVADRHSAEIGILTLDEIKMLLRGWCSAAPTPTESVREELAAAWFGAVVHERWRAAGFTGQPLPSAAG